MRCEPSWPKQMKCCLMRDAQNIRKRALDVCLSVIVVAILLMCFGGLLGLSYPQDMAERALTTGWRE